MGGLTRLQRRVATTVLGVAADHGFALAGGAALIATGESSRSTEDIDAFSPRTQDVRIAAEAVASALEADGLEVQPDRQAETFSRLMATAGSEHRRRQVRVELARDYIEWPLVETALGPALSPRELAANKLLALFSRIKPRDLCDVAILAGKYDLEEMLADAKVKDAGFSRPILAEMVHMVLREPEQRWPAEMDLAVVRDFGHQLTKALEAGEPTHSLRPNGDPFLP